MAPFPMSVTVILERVEIIEPAAQTRLRHVGFRRIAAIQAINPAVWVLGAQRGQPVLADVEGLGEPKQEGKVHGVPLLGRR